MIDLYLALIATIGSVFLTAMIYQIVILIIRKKLNE